MATVLRIIEVVAGLLAAIYIMGNVAAMVVRWRQARRLLPVLAMLMLPATAWAVPSISGVSGTITHGSTITISGSSFGSKGGTNANKPLIWADFESSINPTSLGHLTAWDGNDNLTRNVGGTQYGLSGANAVGTRATGVNAFGFVVQHTMTKLYLSGKRRYSNVGSSNMKFFRIWNDASSSTAASTVSGGIVNDESCDQADRFQGSPLTANAFRMEEFIWSQSTSNTGGAPQTGNGTYRFTMNGTVEQEHPGTLCTHLTANYGQGLGLQVIDTFDTNGELPNGTTIHFDDLYVDNTWAHVIVGNAATLAASTVREVQIPSAWSDTSISVTVNRGSFGTTDTAYVYVIDSANAASAGQSITFGGGGQTANPSVLSMALSLFAPTVTASTTPQTQPSSVILFLEWVPLVSGVLWHVRHWLMAAGLAVIGWTGTTVILAADEVKARGYQAAVVSVKALTHGLERIAR